MEPMGPHNVVFQVKDEDPDKVFNWYILFYAHEEDREGEGFIRRLSFSILIGLYRAVAAIIQSTRCHPLT
jgi:hypothetical protein